MNRRSFFKILGAGIICPSLVLAKLKPYKTKHERLADLMRKALKNTKFKPPIRGNRRRYIVIYDEFPKIIAPKKFRKYLKKYYGCS